MSQLLKKVIFFKYHRSPSFVSRFHLNVSDKSDFFLNFGVKNIRAVTKRGNNLTALQAVIFGGKFARLLKICDMKRLVPLSKQQKSL